MNIKQEIHDKFGDTAFESPVFYSNPGGLRFELSKGGDWLTQFEVAYAKAEEICACLVFKLFGGL